MPGTSKKGGGLKVGPIYKKSTFKMAGWSGYQNSPVRSNGTASSLHETEKKDTFDVSLSHGARNINVDTKVQTPDSSYFAPRPEKERLTTLGVNYSKNLMGGSSRSRDLGKKKWGLGLSLGASTQFGSKQAADITTDPGFMDSKRMIKYFSAGGSKNMPTLFSDAESKSMDLTGRRKGKTAQANIGLDFSRSVMDGIFKTRLGGGANVKYTGAHIAKGKSANLKQHTYQPPGEISWTGSQGPYTSAAYEHDSVSRGDGPEYYTGFHGPAYFGGSEWAPQGTAMSNVNMPEGTYKSGTKDYGTHFYHKKKANVSVKPYLRGGIDITLPTSRWKGAGKIGVSADYGTKHAPKPGLTLGAKWKSGKSGLGANLSYDFNKKFLGAGVSYTFGKKK